MRLQRWKIKDVWRAMNFTRWKWKAHRRQQKRSGVNRKAPTKKKFTPSKKREEKSAVPVLKWSNSNNSNKLKNGAGIRRKAPAQRKAPALRKWRQNQENASGTSTSKDSYRLMMTMITAAAATASVTATAQNGSKRRGCQLLSTSKETKEIEKYKHEMEKECLKLNRR